MPDSPNAFVCFMARPAGRLLRIALGIVLMLWGWSMENMTAGPILIVVGLLPILAGVLNLCLIGPLLGAPVSGRAVLERK